MLESIWCHWSCCCCSCDTLFKMNLRYLDKSRLLPILQKHVCRMLSHRWLKLVELSTVHYGKASQTTVRQLFLLAYKSGKRQVDQVILVCQSMLIQQS